MTASPHPEMPHAPEFSLVRRTIYAILITAAAGLMLGRILAVTSVDVELLERQRLQEISKELETRRAAYVERGVSGERLEAEMARIEAALRDRAVLSRPFLSANDRSRWCTIRALVEPEMRVPGAPYAIDRVIQESRWDTIDMVKHGGHLYSSKPPLFPTLLAGLYWAISRATGWTLRDQPYEVARSVLILVQWLPLIVCLAGLASLVERFARNDWTRIFVVAAGCFGTFLTTMVVSLNNHLPGAVCAFGALFFAVPIFWDGRREVWRFALVGFLAALAVTFELPSLILFVALFVFLLRVSLRRTVAIFLPAAVLVGAAYFYTNWLAHGTLTIPYSHRGENGENWYDYTYERRGRVIESYWRNPVGIDQGEPSVALYVFHSLVGHHGIFTLTPLWLLTAGGVWFACRGGDRRLRALATTVAAASVICLVFYWTRDLRARNYGGLCCGFRWMFWWTPFWLLLMAPALDRLARSRWGRGLALFCLAVSAMSAAYPTWSPWVHPWLFRWLEYQGWISY